VYERRFDWKLAREMHERGETFAEIARTLGVDRRGVARVCKLPKYVVDSEMSEEQVAAMVLAFPRDREPCPRCTRPKTLRAELCNRCRQELRLDYPVTLQTVLGTAGETLVELRSVGLHRIVEIDGNYGVVSPIPPGPSPYRHRFVDFWEIGPQFVDERVRVRVLPSSKVVIGGVTEREEIISDD